MPSSIGAGGRETAVVFNRVTPAVPMVDARQEQQRSRSTGVAIAGPIEDTPSGQLHLHPVEVVQFVVPAPATGGT